MHRRDLCQGIRGARRQRAAQNLARWSPAEAHASDLNLLWPVDLSRTGPD
jgi:hypothetical protein